jgi:hypothetical protein
MRCDRRAGAMSKEGGVTRRAREPEHARERVPPQERAPPRMGHVEPPVGYLHGQAPPSAFITHDAAPLE